MKFNKEKLPYTNKNTKDMISMLKIGIEYLYHHNKNYTKTQWSLIIDLYDLISAIE